MTTYPDRIALIIPALNEERHIRRCLETLLPQASAMGIETLVLDGGSTDETIAIVNEIATYDRGLKLIANPGRLQSAAMNLAARILPPTVTVLVRADAHAVYPPDFLQSCVAALREHDATSVVVPMRTTTSPDSASGLQRAIAAVQNSRLGNGGAAHRAGGNPGGFVDHGHHAAFDRAFFLSLGGYDESFSHNEDAEIDVRAVRAGGRIWMCPQAAVDYIPRDRLLPLARQYARHGAGRARTLLKHGLRPRLRQMAAPIVLLACLASLALSPISTWFLAIPLAYAGLCAAFAIGTAVRRADPWMLAMAPAAMTIHFAWGWGFLRRVAQSLVWRRSAGTQPALAS